MEKQNTKYLTWVDDAKGFAIILVVLGHVILNLSSSGYLKNDFLIGVKNWIYEFHMPLFFFLSGLLVSKYLGNSISSLAKMLERRIISLVVPYISFSILYLAMKCLFSGAGAVLHKASMYEALYLYKNPIGEYWFLYALILFNVIFILIALIRHRIYSVIAMIAIALLFFFIDIFHLNAIEWIGIKRAIPFAMFFFIGVMSFNCVHLCKRKKFIMVLLPIIIYLEILSVNSSVYGRFLSLLYIAFFCVFFNILQIKSLEYLGKNSLVIYLFHPFFVVLCKIFACKIQCDVFVVIFITIVSIALSLLLYEYVIKKIKVLLFFVSPLNVVKKI